MNQQVVLEVKATTFEENAKPVHLIRLLQRIYPSKKVYKTKRYFGVVISVDYVKHKRSNPMCDPWDSQGNEKMQLLFRLLFALNFYF